MIIVMFVFKKEWKILIIIFSQSPLTRFRELNYDGHKEYLQNKYVRLRTCGVVA